MCRELHLSPERLFDRSLDDFTAEVAKVNSPKKREVVTEIAQLRYNHFQEKRKSKD